MDLATSWTLAFFGACVVGGLVGVLFGRLFGFECGIGVGLLIPGLVSLSYVPRFAIDYRALRDDPRRTIGTVVAVEDRPVNAAGDITTPVAIVEYEVDGRRHRIESASASGLHVDDTLTVVPDPARPARSRMGKPDQRLGGAIASMLFGTFPFSAGIYFLACLAVEGRRDDPRRRRPPPRAAMPATRATWIANVLIFASILAGGAWPGDVWQSLLIAFGGASLGLWLHVAEGVHMGRAVGWWLGVAVIAVNFSAWVAALWLIRPSVDSW